MFGDNQQRVPPLMAFHLGSLGFLAPFEFSNYQEQVSNVLEGTFRKKNAKHLFVSRVNVYIDVALKNTEYCQSC